MRFKPLWEDYTEKNCKRFSWYITFLYTIQDSVSYKYESDFILILNINVVNIKKKWKII